jgi:hypothetical protein
VAVFPLALATHEVMHLVIYVAAGQDAVMVVRPWKAPLLGANIFGIHVAAQGPVAFQLRLANDFLGPSLAALLLMVLWLAARGRTLRAALLANIVVQLFYALVESADALFDRADVPPTDFLLWPEFNYGAALLIVLLVVAATWRSSHSVHSSKKLLRIS